MEYLVICFTTTDSMKLKKKLKAQGIEVETLPVPRQLSTDCGIALKFFSDEDISVFIDAGVERIFTCTHNNYQEIFKHPKNND